MGDTPRAACSLDSPASGRGESGRPRASDVALTRGSVGPPLLLGDSAAFTTLKSRLPAIAAAQRTTLIGGPTGSGKDLVARSLHWQAPRSDRTYVVVHCAALPDALAEAELFGYSRGAFTGAVEARPGLIRAAHGGTLFLDEIDSLSPAVQAKLLRFLETGEFRAVGSDRTEQSDAWVLAATNQNLGERVKNGSFRADLMYRLAVVTVEVPALRDRGQDILTLADHFLAGLPRGSLSFSAAARRKLLEYAWPGNVRELKNRVETAGLFSRETQIETSDIELPGGCPMPTQDAAPDLERALSSLVNSGDISLSQVMARCERVLIRAALDAEGDNRTRAAARLGIHVRTMFKKLTP